MNTKFSKKIAKVVTTARKKKKYSTFDLAYHAQIAQSTVMRIEKAETTPNAETIAKVMLCLGIPGEKLLTLYKQCS